MLSFAAPGFAFLFFSIMVSRSFCFLRCWSTCSGGKSLLPNLSRIGFICSNERLFLARPKNSITLFLSRSVARDSMAFWEIELLEISRTLRFWFVSSCLQIAAISLSLKLLPHMKIAQSLSPALNSLGHRESSASPGTYSCSPAGNFLKSSL